MTDTLTQLLQKLDEPAAKYAELERYYCGTQPLAFLSPEAKTALGDRFGRMAFQHSAPGGHVADGTAAGDGLHWRRYLGLLAAQRYGPGIRCGAS